VGGTIGLADQRAGSEQADTRLTKGARTRLRILDAAAHVLRERGYAGTRLSDIAEVAGLQTGSLAFHFPSKDDLIDEVLRHGMAEGLGHVRATVDSLPPDAGPAARITAAVNAHLDGLDDRNDYAVAMLRMLNQFSPETRRRFRDADQAYVGYWLVLVDGARAAGVIPAQLDTRLLVRLLLGAMNATLDRPDAEPREHLVATILFMIGLTRGAL
jgi:AcrR family transcriptional regulator